jgi:hypothetical protein
VTPSIVENEFHLPPIVPTHRTQIIPETLDDDANEGVNFNVIHNDESVSRPLK